MKRHTSWIAVLTAAMLTGSLALAQNETAEVTPASEPEGAVIDLAAPAETTAAPENMNAPVMSEPTATEESNMATNAPAGNPTIVITTSLGVIKAELWADKAPESVANFLRYAEARFYDGTIFHRVIKNFMIQGGGFTPDMNQKPTQAPVKNEARTDVPNKRGTLAMARTFVIDSATSQFFINLVDNAFLDHRDDSAQGFGYCVFGAVTEGLDIVDAIAAVSTSSTGMFQDVPVEPVVIQSIALAQ